MATLAELIYDIRSIASPQIGDDSELASDRQISFWIRTVRSQLLRQDANKGHSFNDALIQTLCVDLESSDASQCCGVSLSCPILKSTKKLPQTVELYQQNSIQSVGPINMTKQHFLLVDFNRLPFVTKGRFTSNEIYTFLKDEYLYVYTENPKYKALKAVAFRGIFDNPEEAKEFKSCTDSEESCFTNDSEYPISQWMIPILKNIILKDYLLIQTKSETISDNQNNAKQDSIPVTN